MNTLGIIGGFGPIATADFYLQIIKECRTLGLSHQPHIIVWNVPVPQIFEEDLLLHNRGINRFKPLLIDAAKKLESAGAEMIVLPCNTLHVFATDIAKSISIPFVNIIEITKELLRKTGVKKLGLLGTSATVTNGLFESTCDLEIVKLDLQLQELLDKGFHQRVVFGTSELIKNAVNQSLQSFQETGIHDILLASTDLHSECPTLLLLRIHDTLDILVKKTAMLFTCERLAIKSQ